MTTFERIKQTAKERGLTLNQLNDKAKLKNNIIYSWKKKAPSAENLYKVADVLGVSVDYLLGNTNEMHETKSTPTNKPIDMKEVAENDTWDDYLSSDGRPLTEHDKKLLRAMFGDQMNQQDIMDIIVGDIKRLGVDFRSVEKLDVVAVINPSKNVGAYDKYRSTPFILAHELFHKLNDDSKRHYLNDIRNPQEHEANVAAAGYLWSIYVQLGGTVEYTQHFLEVSGTPDYLLDRILKLAN